MVKLSDNAIKVLERRYLRKDKNGKIIESASEIFHRVADAIASADKFYGKNQEEIKKTSGKFCRMMEDLEFLPNSPTLMNAGKELSQLSACFVLPIDDSMESIFDCIKSTALIHKSGGGTGFSFSRLRPKSSPVRTTGGVASGPVSFMRVFDAATQAVKQGGTRRGANMGILRIDHPDILEFISCKDSDKDITNFNISIAITDEFMEKLKKQEDYDLIDPRTKEVRKTLNTKQVFDLIVKHAHKNGEPGIIFIDRVNRDNPTPKLGDIESTNPCVVADTLVSTEKGLMRIEDIVREYPQGGLNIFVDESVLGQPTYQLRLAGRDGVSPYGENFGRQAQQYAGPDSNVAIEVEPVRGLLPNGVERRCGLHTISKAFKTGIKPCYRVTTDSGFKLIATADHKIMTNRGWVELKDLSIEKDEILIQPQEGEFNSDSRLPFKVENVHKGDNGRLYKMNLPKNWSKELGQVLGWLVGDGWLREGDKNCRVGFTYSKEEKDILEYFKSIINKFYGASIQEVERENGVWHLSYHSKYFVEFFKKLGVKPWLAQEKEVPGSIFTAPKEAVIGFLQGLFSSDGTLTCNEKHKMRYVRLTSKSVNLLEGAQTLLLNLGIKSRIYDRSRKARYGFEYTNKKGELRQYLLDGELYELNISRESLKVFLDKVGFMNRKHQALVEKLKILNYYSDRSVVKITQIQYIGEREVYDLTEPFTHSFIANGFVISNCGEQPLLPYESCNLGSINLYRLVKENKGKFEFNWYRLAEVVHDAVHFLDNVIEVNKFPLPDIEKKTKLTRKVGLGIMGWASSLERLEIPYNSNEAIDLADKVMSFILKEARKASNGLAKERGSFPAYKDSIFDKNQSEPQRNATLTTIAPTGTISIIAGPTSSGIEPTFAICYYRNVMDNDKLIEVDPVFEEIAKERGFYSRELMEKIAEKGSIHDIEEIPEDVRRTFVTAHDVSPEWHIRMQGAFQKYTDNAVSKTVNFPNKATIDDVLEVYLLAYELGCKGVTIYRDGSREEQVLHIVRKDQKKEEVKDFDIGRIGPRPRPEVTIGTTTKVATGCGNLYVTINSDEEGRPFELFTQMGKAGGCAASQLEAIGRLVSLGFRSGIEVKSIIEQLRSIRCPSPSWEKGGRIFSCADAIARVVEKRLVEVAEVYDKDEEISEGTKEEINVLSQVSKSEEQLEKQIAVRSRNIVGVCPDCGGALRHEEGCIKCYACGFSKC